MTAPQSPDEKCNSIVEELLRAVWNNINGKGVKLFNRENLRTNDITGAFYGIRPYILRKIKGGAEFVGYSDGGWF